jgi:hypothetical protein
LRVALRNGSVFVGHSFAFRSQAMLLIPPEEWKAKRNHLYGHLKLPQDPKAFLEPLIEHLDQGLTVLRDATVRGGVRIDSAVHLDPLSAQTPNPAIEALRRAISPPRWATARNHSRSRQHDAFQLASARTQTWLARRIADGLCGSPGTRYIADGADIARMVPELASAHPADDEPHRR